MKCIDCLRIICRRHADSFDRCDRCHFYARRAGEQTTTDAPPVQCPLSGCGFSSMFEACCLEHLANVHGGEFVHAREMFRIPNLRRELLHLFPIIFICHSYMSVVVCICLCVAFFSIANIAWQYVSPGCVPYDGNKLAQLDRESDAELWAIAKRPPGTRLTYRVQLRGLKYSDYPRIGLAECIGSSAADLQIGDLLFQVDRTTLCGYTRPDITCRATLDGPNRCVYYVAELAGGHEVRSADFPVPPEIDIPKLRFVTELAGHGDSAYMLPPQPRFLWTPKFL